MTVSVNLPDDLVAQIDRVTRDRTTFVVEAVRRFLKACEGRPARDETARINELAAELNREAADVLEYQVIS
jgi:metal-responsive CopG/Arc/MetJ family transcriptional regulator